MKKNSITFNCALFIVCLTTNGNETTDRIILRSEFNMEDMKVRDWFVPEMEIVSVFADLNEILEAAKVRAGDLEYSFVSRSDLDPLEYQKILDSVARTKEWNFVKITAMKIDKGRLQSSRMQWKSKVSDRWFYEVFFTNGKTEIGLVVMEDRTVVKATKGDLDPSKMKEAKNPSATPK